VLEVFGEPAGVSEVARFLDLLMVVIEEAVAKGARVGDKDEHDKQDDDTEMRRTGSERVTRCGLRHAVRAI